MKRVDSQYTASRIFWKFRDPLCSITTRPCLHTPGRSVDGGRANFAKLALSAGRSTGDMHGGLVHPPVRAGRTGEPPERGGASAELRGQESAQTSKKRILSQNYFDFSKRQYLAICKKKDERKPISQFGSSRKHVKI